MTIRAPRVPRPSSATSSRASLRAVATCGSNTTGRLAIRDAIRAAAPDDVVLIAGKGHEDYQIYGTRRRDFSDEQVARAVLEGRA